MAKLARLHALPLYAPFARLYGGADKVPVSILNPASHFQRIPRSGQHATIVIAQSDDGAIGVGEAFGLPHARATSAYVDDVIAPAIRGEALDEPARMLEPLRRYFAAMGHSRGAAMEALAGVDIALWDLRARREGKPLATLLGGAPGPVPVYVSPVPFLPTPAESAAASRAFLAEGWRAVKLKIGRGIATDLAHVEAVRDALGPEPQLMLDVNCAYDVATSIALARALKPFAIAWLEEPVPPDDPAALAEVRRAAPMPIAGGENEFTLASFEAYARAGAVDVLMPNVARAGGISGLMAIGALCAKHGIGLAPHGVGSAIAVAAALHACRAAPGFRIYEANRLPNALRDALARPPLEVLDGALIARDAPGHGQALDWEEAETYRIDVAPGAAGAGARG